MSDNLTENIFNTLISMIINTNIVNNKLFTTKWELKLVDIKQNTLTFGVKTDKKED